MLEKPLSVLRTVDEQLVKVVHLMAWQESGGSVCVESNFVNLQCRAISNYLNSADL